MKPLNKKLIPYSKAFKQVSRILGKEEALKQLERVWECPECFINVDFEGGDEINLSYSLMRLFSWQRSPQGYHYWYNIYHQIQ